MHFQTAVTIFLLWYSSILVHAAPAALAPAAVAAMAATPAIERRNPDPAAAPVPKDTIINHKMFTSETIKKEEEEREKLRAASKHPKDNKKFPGTGMVVGKMNIKPEMDFQKQKNDAMRAKAAKEAHEKAEKEAKERAEEEKKKKDAKEKLEKEKKAHADAQKKAKEDEAKKKQEEIKKKQEEAARQKQSKKPVAGKLQKSAAQKDAAAAAAKKKAAEEEAKKNKKAAKGNPEAQAKLKEEAKKKKEEEAKKKAEAKANKKPGAIHAAFSKVNKKIGATVQGVKASVKNTKTKAADKIHQNSPGVKDHFDRFGATHLWGATNAALGIARIAMP